jgi:hypothetical protein
MHLVGVADGLVVAEETAPRRRDDVGFENEQNRDEEADEDDGLRGMTQPSTPHEQSLERHVRGHDALLEGMC